MISAVHARRNLLCLVQRRSLSGFSLLRTRPALELPPPPGKKHSSYFCGCKLLYTAGGAGLGIAGWIWMRRTDSDSDDPRDKRALSNVPLAQLITGWM